MFKIIKVSGDSMSPEFVSGDFVLISALPKFFGLMKAGQNMVFCSSEYGLLLKKITRINKKQVFFKGNRASSLSSDELGPVNREDILGITLFHFKVKKSQLRPGISADPGQ